MNAWKSYWQEEGSDPSPEPDPVPGRPDSYPKGSVVINEVMAKPGKRGNGGVC